MKHLVLPVLAAALALAACTDTAAPPPTSTPTTTPATSSPGPIPSTAPSPSPSPSPTATATPPGTVPGLAPVDALSDGELADLAVNEVARVMVSEWHVIGADADGDYATTLETFRSQLQELYDRGYRPVTTREYRDATFPIPAGTRPVLLTFDDSTPNHFQWDDDGTTPDPDSVVGILEDFAAEHEDWRSTAVFAYNWNTPFGSSDDEAIAAKLQWLVDHGYELSNHTVTHTSLADLSDQEVQDELGDNVDNVTDLVPGATVDTLTLPFGIHPADESLAVSGTSTDGTTYTNELVFEVGWMPDSSPNHEEYDPTSIMRVPAHGPWGPDDLDWWDWLDWLDEDGRAFVSDGDPDTITYPEGFAEVATVDDGAATRTYPSGDAG